MGTIYVSSIGAGKVFGWEIAEPHWDYWAVITDGGTKKPRINGGIGKGDSIDEAISNAKTVVR